MLKKYFFLSALTLNFFSVSFTGVYAGDLKLGKVKVESVCRTCHGVDGLGTVAGVPNLAGQKEDYIVTQLKAFRAARRQHAQMSIIAQMLSDEDIDNVAAWYSSIKISLELPE